MTNTTLPARPASITGDLRSASDSLRFARTPGGRLYVEAVRLAGGTYRLTKDVRKPAAEEALAWLERQRENMAAAVEAAAKPAREPAITREQAPSQSQPAQRASRRVEKYGAAVVERSKLVRHIDGYKNPASLRQHAALDKTVRKALKEAGLPLSPEGLVRLVGLNGVDDFVPYAQSKGGAPTPFRALMQAVPSDVDLRPRHIAASLWAWAQQMDEAGR